MIGFSSLSKKASEAGEERKPSRFYILGDIRRPEGMSRIKAEGILFNDSLYFSKKESHKEYKYENFVCVMHLASRIFGEAPVDVPWIFEDTSLYQKADGMFFTARCESAPYGGGQYLISELEANYFETHSPTDFRLLLETDLDLAESGIAGLFEKRKSTFYAERWLSYDYRVLYGLSGYGIPDRDFILSKEDDYRSRFSCSPDRNDLYNHLEKETQKALEAVKNDTWKKEEPKTESYNPLVAQYK